jgi:hypothetical protein
MKSSVNLLVVLFHFMLCLSSVNFFSQEITRTCLTPKLNAEYENAFQSFLANQSKFSNIKKTSTIYTIPVVFHVVHNGEGVGAGRNISQAQLNSQITILNEDFRKTNSDFNTWVTQSSFINASADCEINFCLAAVDPSGTEMIEPGIDRIDRNAKGWSGPSYQGYNEPGGYIDNTIKANSYWDPTKYMNIWVIDMNDNVLGYAQFPTILTALNPVTDMFNQGGLAITDGVVLDYRATGNIGAAASPFDKGRTATHEIGHWLGLWHINGDATCGNDYVSDTPEQSSLSSSCPTTIGATVNSGCTNSPNPPGKMYQNYMDYTHDKCLTLFTAGQKARMQAVLGNCVRRLSLTTSTVCASVGIKETNLDADIKVFPNPTSGIFNIECKTKINSELEIELYNSIGQMIISEKNSAPNRKPIEIDLTNFNSGVYVVLIKTISGNITKRLIKN